MRIQALPWLILLPAVSFSQELRHSVQSGNWSNKNTWDCDCVPAQEDSVVINSGHTVTFVANNMVGSLTIQEGGIISDNGLTNTITGHLTVDGIYSGSGPIILNGESKRISGKGVISNTGNITITGTKTIVSGSELIKNTGNISISINTTITNQGVVTIGGNIMGANNSTSVWVNDANSTLNIGGALLGTGTLHAFASSNTVNYYGSSHSSSNTTTPILCNASSPCQSIKRPSSGIYHNLKISGASSTTKRLVTGNFFIEGDLTIHSTFNAINHDIELKGDWINTGGSFSATDPGQKVAMTGSSGQYISTLLEETFYVLEINKSGPDNQVYLDNTVNVFTSLNLLNGYIHTGNNKVVVGEDESNTGNIIRNNGYVIGKVERWIATESVPDPPVLFPLGTDAYYRPISVSLNNLASSGSLLAEFKTDYPGNDGLPLSDGGLMLTNTFRDGYWKLTASHSLACDHYNLSVTANGFTGFPVIDDNTRLLFRPTSETGWMSGGSHVTYSGSNAVSRSGLAVITAEFALGDDTPCSAPGGKVISGNASVCAADAPNLYSIEETPGHSYQWFVSGGIIISDPFLHEVLVDWGDDGKAGQLSVTESNACTQGPDNILYVEVHSIPPASITGKQNVPENGAALETYSIEEAVGYSYFWEIEGNGTITGEQGTNIVTVLWGNEGLARLKVYATYAGCGISNPAVMDINIYKVIFSNRANGNWDTNNTWTCSCTPGEYDNVVIRSGHTVSLNNNSGTFVNHLTIDAGGVLSMGNRNITVSGDLNLNGSVVGPTSSAGTLILSGGAGSATLDGIGIITTPVITFTASRSISPTALLTKTQTGNNTFNVHSTVINNGSITLAGGLYGNSSGIWINGANSTINIGGQTLASGTLDASATGNTVRYTGTTSNNIKVPNNSGQYYHLAFSGSGTKTAPSGSSIRVMGNFINDGTGNGGFASSTGTVTFNGASVVSGIKATTFNTIILTGALTSHEDTLKVGGTFTNNGTFIHNNGTVNFTGTATSIAGTATTVFNNIVVSSGVLTLNATLNTIKVNGEFINHATFNGNTGTVEFVGPASSISGNSAPDFHHLKVTGSLASSPGTINISGDFTNNGSFNPNNGTILFNGAGTQSVDANGAGMYRVEVNKPNGELNLISELQLNHWLNILSASVINSNGHLIIRSRGNTTDLDAAIGPVPNGATINGNVTVERFMNPIGQTFRYIASPVYNALPPAVLGNRLFRYAYVAGTGGWTNHATTAPFALGTGYSVRMPVGSSEITWSVQGPVHTGSFVWNLPEQGWHLLGNPYPSAIRWFNDPEVWTLENIATTIAVTDNTVPGYPDYFRYWSYDVSDNPDTWGAGPLQNGVVAMAQAFWVYAGEGGGKLTIREPAKALAVTGKFYRQKTTPLSDYLIIGLSDGQFMDHAFLKINPEAPDQFNLEGYAPKLSLAPHDVFLIDPHHRELLMFPLREVPASAKLPLGIRAQPGTYVLHFSNMENFPNALHLFDAVTRKTIPLEAPYAFQVTHSASASNRFFLIRKSTPEVSTTPTAIFPNPAHDSVTIRSGPGAFRVEVTDLHNRLIWSGSSTESLDLELSGYSKGLYLIRIITEQQTVTHKLMKL